MQPTTTEDTIAIVPAAPAARRWGRGSARLWNALALVAAAALLALGAYRLYRDLRPIPDMAALESLVRRGKLDEAEAGLRALLDQSPRHGAARRLLAQTLARRGEKVACARELARMPVWWPGHRDDQFIQGQSLLEANHAREAEAAYLTCVQDDPLHPAAPERVTGAAKALVALYVMQQRVPEAQEVLRQAYAQASPGEKGAILNMRMRAHIEQIEPREAIDALGRYVAADPTDWQARLGLAQAYELDRQPGRADEQFGQCLKERPDSAEAWSKWLRLLAGRNNAEELHQAIESMPGALRTAEDNATLLELMGVDRLNQGDDASAFEYLEAAVRLDPYNPDSHYRLATAAQKVNRPDVAEAHRATSQRIRKERQSIPEALLAFRNAERSGTHDERVEAALRLSRICEEVGWLDLGREWLRFAHSQG